MFSKLLSILFKDKDKPITRLEKHALYYYAGCPFCLRVILSMKKFGVELEMRNIHKDKKYYNELKDGGGRTMVPCLRIERNSEILWMYESADIVKYLKAVSCN